ncbi:MAG: CpaF family protein [Silvanigrellales bacterium]|nr:CpaF family protein [Silvanigrellales bacterium]
MPLWSLRLVGKETSLAFEPGAHLVFGSHESCDVRLPARCAPIEATLVAGVPFCALESGSERRTLLSGTRFSVASGVEFHLEGSQSAKALLEDTRPSYERACALTRNELFLSLVESLPQLLRENPSALDDVPQENDFGLLSVLSAKIDVLLGPGALPSEEAFLLHGELLWSAWARLRGHGALSALLAKSDVTEIMVFGAERCYVERGGTLAPVPSPFKNAAELRALIERMVARAGRRIDEASPACDCRLPDGSRVHAILPPLAVDGPSLTIRTFRAKFLGADALVSLGSATSAQMSLLKALVMDRRNVIVAGGTGTGKTTLLNALSSFIPEEERVVTIEDSAELQLSQAHVVRLEARQPNVEGKGAVPVRELVRHALRMRPDRIVVGECRGGEALDMLQAMNTGHDGSMTTLHANSPLDALRRLETLVLFSGVDLPLRAIREQIASAVQGIVFLERTREGSRRVASIAEVSGLSADGSYVLAENTRFLESGAKVLAGAHP